VMDQLVAHLHHRSGCGSTTLQFGQLWRVTDINASLRTARWPRHA
jgi:hypothetical protein